jgi:hypothetical protein
MTRRWFKRFVISTFIVVFIGVSLALFASQNPALVRSSQWLDAANHAPAELMAQVVQDNIQPDVPIDAGRMKIWKVDRSGQKQALYLIDARITDMANYPHANPLCGVSGCAFFAYRSEGGTFQQVWSDYLNVNLPPGVLLIEVDDELKNGLPELSINQMQGKQIQKSRLSFNGQSYETTQVLLLPKRYD